MCYPLTSYIEIVNTGNFLKPGRIPDKMFWCCNTKKFQRENVIGDPYQFFLSFETTIFLKLESVPLQLFVTVSQQIFDGKRDNLSLPLLHKFFDNRSFRNTKEIPYVFFSALWDKNFLIEKRDTTPPQIQKAFRQTIFPETPKGSSTNCFGTRRHKQLNVKLWYSPFLLSLNFFETRTILGHKKRPQRNASVVQDKNFLLLKRAIGSETENKYSNNKTKNFVVKNPSVSSHQEIENSSTA